MAFWRKQTQYDSCEKACYDPVQSLAGIPAYSFAEAVRAVVDAPKLPSGPQMILLAEEGSIENPEAVPDNIKIVYYATGSRRPEIFGAGY